MSQIFFHHYDTSPFGELVRVTFGLKGLQWHSVIIPVTMPKPDLVELTGGYGRTPVMQIGADIYCDTAAILDALDKHHPSPSLYPAPMGTLHRIVAGWAGAAQFGAHVGAAMRNLPAGALGPDFAADRKRRFVGFDFDMMPTYAPHLETQALAASHWVEDALSDGRAFIGGDAAGHGDLALYSNAWFLKAMPFSGDFAAKVFSLPKFAAWYDRLAAFGHGTRVETDADASIQAAATSDPAPCSGPVEDGFEIGQPVLIQTETSGDDPVAGTLLRSGPTGITIQRTSSRAGTVNVHFPRIGQIVRPA